MQKSRGGLGTSKHHNSGNAGRSPKFKFHQQLEAKADEARSASKPKPKVVATIAELFKPRR
jgi:hypothetical protein